MYPGAYLSNSASVALKLMVISASPGNKSRQIKPLGYVDYQTFLNKFEEITVFRKAAWLSVIKTEFMKHQCCIKNGSKKLNTKTNFLLVRRVKSKLILTLAVLVALVSVLHHFL